MARRPLPAIGAGEPALTKQFLEHVTRRETAHRIDMMSEWEKARLYVLHNKQWLRKDYSWGDVTRTPFWTPIVAPRGRFFPMPVYNMLLEPLQNEAARLIGAGYEWDVAPTDASPRKREAARLAKDVLAWQRQKLRWVQLEGEGFDQAVLFGTRVLKTGMEANFTEVERYPSTTAVRCTAAGCSFKLTTPKVQQAALDRHANEGKPVDERRLQRFYRERSEADDLLETAPEVTETRVRACLTCPDAPPLARYVPEQDEARDARDYFGRSMGIDLPICDVYAENIPVYDFFPENDGLCSPQLLREWAEERIVPVEYVQERWKNGRLVEPESVTDLLRWHPVVSSLHGWDTLTTYDHHTVLRTYHRKPQVVWNDDALERYNDTGEITVDRGRSVVMAGRHVMLDDHYMVQSQENPSLYIPRVQYHLFSWQLREGETFGMAAAAAALPLQDNGNTLLAQLQYNRHVFGSPKLKAPDGSQLYQAGYEDTGYSGDVIYFTADAGTEGPEVLQGSGLHGDWKTEFETYINGVASVIGTQQVEVGAPPGKDVTAAAALMNLTQQAGTRRRPRTVRYAEDFLAPAGRHLLLWTHEIYREDRYYSVAGPGSRISVKSFKGADLLGQFDVKVTVRPAHDTPEFRQQALIDAVDREILAPSTAGDKARLAKEMGAPTDIVAADQNRQVAMAEEEFVAFYVEGRAPVVRLDGDDHVIHRQQHLLDWISQDMERRKEACGWYEAEQALDGWRTEWQALEATALRLKTQPPEAGPRMPPANPVSGEITATDIAGAVKSWQHDMQAQQVIDAMPEPHELRVFSFLKSRLLSKMFPTPKSPYPGMAAPGPRIPLGAQRRVADMMSLLRFYAHIETHKAKAIEETAAAQMGLPVPASPGGAQDARGMIPGDPANAQPGAGAGPGAVTAGAPS